MIMRVIKHLIHFFYPPKAAVRFNVICTAVWCTSGMIPSSVYACTFLGQEESSCRHFSACKHSSGWWSAPWRSFFFLNFVENMCHFLPFSYSVLKTLFGVYFSSSFLLLRLQHRAMTFKSNANGLFDSLESLFRVHANVRKILTSSVFCFVMIRRHNKIRATGRPPFLLSLISA